MIQIGRDLPAAWSASALFMSPSSFPAAESRSICRSHSAQSCSISHSRSWTNSSGWSFAISCSSCSTRVMVLPEQGYASPASGRTTLHSGKRCQDLPSPRVASPLLPPLRECRSVRRTARRDASRPNQRNQSVGREAMRVTTEPECQTFDRRLRADRVEIHQITGSSARTLRRGSRSRFQSDIYEEGEKRRSDPPDFPEWKTKASWPYHSARVREYTPGSPRIHSRESVNTLRESANTLPGVREYTPGVREYTPRSP